MSPRIRAFVAAVGLAALALLATHVPVDWRSDGGHYVAWILLCLMSDSLWAKNLGGVGTRSLSSTAGLATVLLWGQGPAMWIGFVSTAIGERLLLRKGWTRAGFNAAQTVITLWAAGLVFRTLGGPADGLHAIVGQGLNPDMALRLTPPFVALCLTYYAFNRTLVVRIVSWSSERTFVQALRQDWLYTERIIADLASFLLAPLMVISYHAIGYVGVMLFYAPLFMIHESDRRYQELKQAEEANLKSARLAAKGELAAGIGHELNNRIAAIKARAQLILKDLEKQKYDNLQRYFETILEQTERMERMSKGLMDYTRNELHVEPLDLNGLLVNTIDFIKSEKRFRGIEWIVQLDPAVPEMHADIGQIQGVFINLFVNAADAMGEQEGRRAIVVKSTFDLRSATANVRVSDTGPGIQPEHLPHMFEPRFTTKADGHGYGLATAYRTLVNHGGHISVKSEPGAGAHFDVGIPLRAKGSPR